jgi:hypothetical protein
MIQHGNGQKAPALGIEMCPDLSEKQDILMPVGEDVTLHKQALAEEGTARDGDGCGGVLNVQLLENDNLGEDDGQPYCGAYRAQIRQCLWLTVNKFRNTQRVNRKKTSKYLTKIS